MYDSAVSRARRPETLNENAIRRLDAQMDRIRRLFELGEYDEVTFMLKRSEIKGEQERLREHAAALPDHVFGGGGPVPAGVPSSACSLPR